MEISQQALEVIWRLCLGIGAALWAVGVMIEPNPSIWVFATSGSFFAIAFGRDRSILRMLVHLGAGTLIGMTIASLLTWKLGTPQGPIAFLIGLFGVDLAIMVRARVKDGTLLKSLGDGIAAIWSRKK